LVNKAQSASKAIHLSSVTQLIADGVNIVLARPLLVLIPFLLDLQYLLGWRVTLQPVMDRLAADAHASDRSGSEGVGDFLEHLGSLDIAGMVATLVPSFLGGIDRDGLYAPVSHDAVAIDNAAFAAGVVVAMIVIAAGVYAFFGLWLADTGIARNRSWEDRFRRVPITGVRIVGLAALVLGLLLLLTLPIGLVWAATSIAGAQMQGLFLPLIAFIVITVIVLFYFAPEALFVAETGPADSMRLSAKVVRRHIWPTLAFALATLIVSAGLSEIWERMAANPPGMLIAMLASGFMGSSLAIASMLFFNERWKALELEPVQRR
jgi:hypothetical protein